MNVELTVACPLEDGLCKMFECFARKFSNLLKFVNNSFIANPKDNAEGAATSFQMVEFHIVINGASVQNNWYSSTIRRLRPEGAAVVVVPRLELVELPPSLLVELPPSLLVVFPVPSELSVVVMFPVSSELSVVVMFPESGLSVVMVELDDPAEEHIPPVQVWTRKQESVIQACSTNVHHSHSIVGRAHGPIGHGCIVYLARQHGLRSNH